MVTWLPSIEPIPEAGEVGQVWVTGPAPYLKSGEWFPKESSGAVPQRAARLAEMGVISSAPLPRGSSAPPSRP